MPTRVQPKEHKTNTFSCSYRNPRSNAGSQRSGRDGEGAAEPFAGLRGPNARHRPTAGTRRGPGAGSRGSGGKTTLGEGVKKHLGSPEHNSGCSATEPRAR